MEREKKGKGKKGRNKEGGSLARTPTFLILPPLSSQLDHTLPSSGVELGKEEEKRKREGEGEEIGKRFGGEKY